MATVGLLGLGPTTSSGDGPSAISPPIAPSLRDHGRPHEFTFTRGVYSSGLGRRRRASWRTDYPKADRQFITVLRRLVGLDADEGGHAVRLDDPELRRYPFLYTVEVGYMSLTDAEARGLRDYLLAGGFLVVDDFWGTRQWWNFEDEIRRVLPEYPIVDLPPDHPVFHTFYSIDEVLQVPSINNALYGRTWEQDGYVPVTRGIFDEKGRLMVAINWNTDLGDAWEWAEDPRYPLPYSTFAYEMGANLVIYGMSR